MQVMPALVNHCSLELGVIQLADLIGVWQVVEEKHRVVGGQVLLIPANRFSEGLENLHAAHVKAG